MNLIFQNGDKAGTCYELQAPGACIGRESDNDIQLLVSGVSRYHAKITQENGGWIISDIGSSNGTFVNQGKIEKPQPLNPDDVIQIGDQILLFTEKKEAEQPKPMFTEIETQPSAPTEVTTEKIPPAISLEALKKGKLFEKDSGETPEAGAGKKKGFLSGRRGNIIFGLFIVMLALVGLFVFRLLKDIEKQERESAEKPVKDKMFYLFYSKNVSAKDNIFRFTLTVEDGNAIFKIDDLASGRHFTRTESPIDPQNLSVLKAAVQETDFMTLKDENGIPEDPSVDEKRVLAVALDGRFNKVSVRNAYAKTSFEKVESAIFDFAASYDFQVSMMTFEEMLQDGLNAFHKAEELFANRQATPANIRNAITRYEYAMKCFEQKEPRPKEWNEARKQLDIAKKAYEQCYNDLVFEIKRCKQLKEYDQAIKSCTRMLELIGPENADLYKRWASYKLAFEKMVKSGKKK